MLDATIIEVAIGMIFVFSLLSILVTQINTFILNVLNLRAKQLKEGLVKLVTDKEIQAKILAHPLIRMVEETVDPQEKLRRQEAAEIIEMQATKVSYIAPSTFVEALLGVLTSESDASIFLPLTDAISALPNDDRKVLLREALRDFRSFGKTDTRDIRKLILELPNETHRQVLSYALEEVENSLGRLPVRTGQMIPLMEGIRKIKDPAFQSAISTVIITAQNLDDTRAKLQAWFNDGMDRISDLYKRRIQYISLAVGLVLALILNVDTFQLARSFWEDPALRTAVATTAKRNISQIENEINQQQAVATPTPPDTLPEMPSTQADSEQQRVESAAVAQAAVQQSGQQISNTVQQLLDLQLPIGWEYTPVTEELIATSQLAGLPDPRSNLRNTWNFVPSNTSDWLSNIFRKLVGIIVTTIAVAQGAPFWFDLLRRLSGGNNPPASAPPPTINVNVDREGAQG
jgi:23S rRNA maturation mini-RNase III